MQLRTSVVTTVPQRLAIAMLAATMSLAGCQADEANAPVAPGVADPGAETPAAGGGAVATGSAALYGRISNTVGNQRARRRTSDAVDLSSIDHVRVTNLDGVVLARGPVDADGRFRFEDLAEIDAPFMVEARSGRTTVVKAVVPVRYRAGQTLAVPPLSLETSAEADAFLLAAEAFGAHEIDAIGLVSTITEEMIDAGTYNLAFGAVQAQVAFGAVLALGEVEAVDATTLQGLRGELFSKLVVDLDAAAHSLAENDAWGAWLTRSTTTLASRLNLDTWIAADAHLAGQLAMAMALRDTDAADDARVAAARAMAEVEYTRLSATVRGPAAAGLTAAYQQYLVAIDAAADHDGIRAAHTRLVVELMGDAQQAGVLATVLAGAGRDAQVAEAIGKVTHLRGRLFRQLARELAHDVTGIAIADRLTRMRAESRAAAAELTGMGFDVERVNAAIALAAAATAEQVLFDLAMAPEDLEEPEAEPAEPAPAEPAPAEPAPAEPAEPAEEPEEIAEPAEPAEPPAEPAEPPAEAPSEDPAFPPAEEAPEQGEASPISVDIEVDPPEGGADEGREDLEFLTRIIDEIFGQQQGAPGILEGLEIERMSDADSARLMILDDAGNLIEVAGGRVENGDVFLNLDDDGDNTNVLLRFVEILREGEVVGRVLVDGASVSPITRETTLEATVAILGKLAGNGDFDLTFSRMFIDDAITALGEGDPEALAEALRAGQEAFAAMLGTNIRAIEEITADARVVLNNELLGLDVDLRQAQLRFEQTVRQTLQAAFNRDAQGMFEAIATANAAVESVLKVRLGDDFDLMAVVDARATLSAAGALVASRDEQELRHALDSLIDATIFARDSGQLRLAGLVFAEQLRSLGRDQFGDRGGLLGRILGDAVERIILALFTESLDLNSALANSFVADGEGNADSLLTANNVVEAFREFDVGVNGFVDLLRVIPGLFRGDVDDFVDLLVNADRGRFGAR